MASTPTKKAASSKTRSEKARERGPATYDRLKKKQARTANVPVYLDDDLAQQVADLDAEIEKDRLYLARIRSNKSVDEERQAEYEDRVAKRDELAEELEEVTVTMRFAALGRAKLEELLEEHPPTQKDKDEAEKQGGNPPDFNNETFPPALVALSCVEPADLAKGEWLDEEQDPPRRRFPRAEELFDEWNASELGAIFGAAWNVNTTRRVINQGNG